MCFRSVTRWIAGVIIILCACGKPAEVAVQFPSAGPFENLSAYHLYHGDLSDLIPHPQVMPYTVTNELFTDYAWKQRLVWMPDSVQAQVQPDGMIRFPSGTILAKTFYYPADFRHPEGNKKIIETRLLINRGGQWEPLTYLWNEAQTEAVLDKIGTSLPIEWLDEIGQPKNTTYLVPNKNQCKSCHRYGDVIEPVGPKYTNMVTTEANQLNEWVNKGFLKPLPATLTSLKLMPHWQDTSASIDQRAKAYLDVNCVHCHRPAGPGGTSGLYLDFLATRPEDWGINKPPVSAGTGSGNLQFDIAPGQSDASILVYRMESLDPGVMMPELGRTMVHQEAMHVIRDWIDQLPH